MGRPQARRRLRVQDRRHTFMKWSINLLYTIAYLRRPSITSLILVAFSRTGGRTSALRKVFSRLAIA